MPSGTSTTPPGKTKDKIMKNYEKYYQDTQIRFIALDRNGSPLQFTASGRSVQCAKRQADTFPTKEAAIEALTKAEEHGGSAEPI